MVMLLAVAVIAHLLYSASMAATWPQAPGRGWKILMAYLLTDEPYAVTIREFERVQRNTTSDTGSSSGPASTCGWAGNSPPSPDCWPAKPSGLVGAGFCRADASDNGPGCLLRLPGATGQRWAAANSLENY